MLNVVMYVAQEDPVFDGQLPIIPSKDETIFIDDKKYYVVSRDITIDNGEFHHASLQLVRQHHI